MPLIVRCIALRDCGVATVHSGHQILVEDDQLNTWRRGSGEGKTRASPPYMGGADDEGAEKTRSRSSIQGTSRTTLALPRACTHAPVRGAHGLARCPQPTADRSCLKNGPRISRWQTPCSTDADRSSVRILSLKAWTFSHCSLCLGPPRRGRPASPGSVTLRKNHLISGHPVSWCLSDAQLNSSSVPDSAVLVGEPEPFARAVPPLMPVFSGTARAFAL